MGGKSDPSILRKLISASLNGELDDEDKVTDSPTKKLVCKHARTRMHQRHVLI